MSWFGKGRRYGRSAEERFWEKVDRRGPNECWAWIGGVTSKDRPYGKFSRSGNSKDREPATRSVWILTYGEFTPGLEVCHRCDNPACVNPSHLFLGTHTDNMRDAARKGRRPRKLTAEQAIEIKGLLASGLRPYAIARRFGVTGGCIVGIAQGRSWRHV